MSAKKNVATIQPTERGTYVLVVDDNVRHEARTRALCAMYGARQGLYKGRTPRRRPAVIPSDLEDLRVIRNPQAAKIVGEGYPRFLAESKAGLWGPRVQVGVNIFGHYLGDLKRGMAARIVK
jgi:hypothetical protein